MEESEKKDRESFSKKLCLVNEGVLCLKEIDGFADLDFHTGGTATYLWHRRSRNWRRGESCNRTGSGSRRLRRGERVLGGHAGRHHRMYGRWDGVGQREGLRLRRGHGGRVAWLVGSSRRVVGRLGGHSVDHWRLSETWSDRMRCKNLIC